MSSKMGYFLIFFLYFFKAHFAHSTEFNPKSCEDPNRFDFLVKNKAACRPQILYSWGSFDKIERIAKEWDNGANHMREIFTSRSSIATYGYGDYAIRIKLKPGIKFQQAEGCNHLRAEERKNTVVVRVWGVRWSEYPGNGVEAGEDYILCSLDSIDSWSYGTSKHLKEMNKELSVVNQKSSEVPFLYAKDRYQRWVVCQTGNSEDTLRTYTFADQRPKGCKIDAWTDFSSERLESNLERMRDLKDKKLGRIYFRKSWWNDLNYKKHFESNFPTYFQIFDKKQNDG